MIFRLIFAFIVFGHAFIHLLGFVKAWDIAPVPRLSGRTLFAVSDRSVKGLGVFWLTAFLGFTVSTIAFLLQLSWWWLAAACSVVVSQLLIVMYWRDARFGTIVNLVIIPAILAAYADWNFQRNVNAEVTEMLKNSVADRSEVVTGNMLRGLPYCVRKWLEHSNSVGKERIRSVRLRQTGIMRTKPESSWMPTIAEQYFVVDTPAFIWKAEIQPAPLVFLSGRDRYEGGKGQMLIKLYSFFTVADSKGKEVDQGTMVRYLAETIWFPSAALNNYISWEAIDSSSARATMTLGDVSATGTFSFTREGDVKGFEARRYGEFGGEYSLETWSIAMTGYKEFQGIRIPNKSEVTWKLKLGDFTWFKLEITELEYNTPEVY